MGHSATIVDGRLRPAMFDWMHASQRDTATMANDAAMIMACGSWRAGFDPHLDLTARD
jgi:hypothetical protein